MYIVQVYSEEKEIGNYTLDQGSLNFHLDLERKLPFDYVDSTKFQCCLVSISEEQYELNKNKENKIFTNEFYTCYSIEKSKRIEIKEKITIKITRN